MIYDFDSMQEFRGGQSRRMRRPDQLKQVYRLQPHEEGGHFAESYTAPFEKDGRALSGSIYFLLDSEETSRFHEIDCDEVWYFHEGCGMRIIELKEGERKVHLLSSEQAMVVIPKGSIFAAENLDPKGYTFVSCMTTPKFSYAGFRLVEREELIEKYGGILEELKDWI